MVSIDTLVSIAATSLSSLERFVGYVSGCYFPRTDTNVQLHPPRREVHPCIRERCQEKTIENELSRVVNAVGDSEPDQKPRSSESITVTTLLITNLSIARE
jgi:hypothetical protein